MGSSRSSNEVTNQATDNRSFADNRSFVDSRQDNRVTTNTVNQNDNRSFADNRQDNRSTSVSTSSSTRTETNTLEAGSIQAGGSVTITDGGIAANAFGFADSVGNAAFSFANQASEDIFDLLGDVSAGQQSQATSLIEGAFTSTIGEFAQQSQRNLIFVLVGLGIFLFFFLGDN